jgi:preprotein translocase subunit SecD
MARLKEIFTNWRVLILIFFLLLALSAIRPQFWDTEGISVRSVVPNSSAAIAGMINPKENSAPLDRERIVKIDGVEISSVDDYYDNTNNLKQGSKVILQNDEGKTYVLSAKENDQGEVDLGLRVSEAPSTNLRKGLELEGGTRVILAPTEPVEEDILDLTIDNLKERLNVYGLSDVVVRKAADLSGDDFIVIEIAGVTEDEVRELLAKQGKFEAKVGNESVFLGGKKDITYVCRSAECSGIDPRRGCFQAEGGYACAFFFGITLSQEAADRQAGVTKDLGVVSEEGGKFLSQSLTLYLDDKEVDVLRIGAELKGRAATQIQISGSGVGINQQDAMNNALKNMKKLQTVIMSGSLPVNLEVVKMDKVSPSLGEEFLQNVLLIGVLALLAVIATIIIRYRQIKVIIPMALTLVSEVVLILGFASFFKWNLDMAAIAAVIIAVGTGVDHLVVITDETVHAGEEALSWKERIKRAMFIVFGAYFTVLVGMVPLYWAGAGLLKGFALTTIASLSFGVLIARPAFAAVVEILMKE